MSQQSNTVYKTFIAGADLTGKENLFVELTGEHTVDVCNADTDVPIGVLTDYYRAAQGQSVTVAIGGTVRVKAGGAISAGAWVGTDGNGKAVAKAADGDVVRGIALEAASADGDVIEVFLVGPFTLRVVE